METLGIPVTRGIFVFVCVCSLFSRSRFNAYSANSLLKVIVLPSVPVTALAKSTESLQPARYELHSTHLAYSKPKRYRCSVRRLDFSSSTSFSHNSTLLTFHRTAP